MKPLNINESGLPVCTVGYLVRGEGADMEIRLSTKAATPKAVKRKIAGKLIGYGGDVEPGDASIPESFARELREESEFKADPKDMEVMARVVIVDEKGPRLVLYYLLVRAWSDGAAKADDREMLDPKWYPAKPLPDNILEADKLILPRILEGEKLVGSVTYDADMQVVANDLVTAQSIE